jgi:putative flippase GtrA
MHQFARFITASSVGALINYVATIAILARWPSIRPQAGALAGIAAGMLFNFIASRYLVFRMSHVKIDA